MPKAAVFTAQDHPLEILDLDLEAPQVKVRLGASGVCHSDLSVMNGTMPIPPPIVLGHEGAGIVEEVGEGVTSVKVGDHIVVSWTPQCGVCYWCTHGQSELCSAGELGFITGGLLDGTHRFHNHAGDAIGQMATSGTFSEATIIPAISAVKIDDSIPLTVGALIGCGVLTGFGAAANTANIQPGDSVVVIGTGGVGLNVIQGAKYKGAERIIAIDMLDNKLEMAKQFGATDTINPSTQGDAIELVKELTGGRGADVAFEVIGLRSTIDQAVNITRRGGETVLVGVPKMDVDLVTNATFNMLIAEKTIKGCWYGSSKVQRDVPLLTGLYQKGELKLDELITREIKLEDVNDAFRAMEAGEVARSVIVY
jgi:S-(hydroxymethyl)glutathione dehydrogenase/alcohol dehydrogenase